MKKKVIFVRYLEFMALVLVEAFIFSLLDSYLAYKWVNYLDLFNIYKMIKNSTGSCIPMLSRCHYVKRGSIHFFTDLQKL